MPIDLAALVGILTLEVSTYYMQARRRLIGPVQKIDRTFPHNNSKLPKEIWFKIFELLTIKELGRLASVTKYLESAVNVFELSHYCESANLRNNRFKEPAKCENLNVEKLNFGWIFGNRKLRMLLEYATGNDSPVITKFIAELTANLFDAKYNGFLRNPYLRNLLLCGAIMRKDSELGRMLNYTKWGGCKIPSKIGLKLLGRAPLQLQNFIEPSSTFLFEYFYRQYNARNSPQRRRIISLCKEFLLSVSENTLVFFANHISYRASIQQALYEKSFCHCFYLQPEVTIHFLLRIEKANVEFEQIRNYPFLSPVVRAWLVMKEWLPDLERTNRCITFFIFFIEMFGKKLSHTDQEALIKQLAKLNNSQREVYCAELLKFCDDPVRRKNLLNVPGDRVKALFKKVVYRDVSTLEGVKVCPAKMSPFEIDIHTRLLIILNLTPQLQYLFFQSLITVDDIERIQPKNIFELDAIVTFCKDFKLNQKLISKLVEFSLQGCAVLAYHQFFTVHGIDEPLIERLKFMLAKNSQAFLQPSCAKLIKAIGLATFNRWPVILESRSWVIETLDYLDKVSPAKCDELIRLIQEAIQEGSSLDISFSVGKHERGVGAKHKTMFFHEKFNAEKRRKRNPQGDDTETEPEHAFEYDYLQISLQS